MARSPTLEGFVFTEKLGRGSYATVYKAYRKSSDREVVAVKCVEKNSLTKSAVENLLTEIEILKKVKHEFIVELKDFQWDSHFIYLIMEYCSGGDLSHFIRWRRRLPEITIRKFLQQIDFGFAQYLQPETEGTSLRGSPLYMAPEILLNRRYDARVDLWSVGIILYECLFGQAPFSSGSFAELAEKIKSTKPIKIPYGVDISDTCRHLVLQLLQRDPDKRITFEEFFDHPFLDLQHMPCLESYKKGVELVQQAVLKDTSGHYTEAVRLYCEGLQYLVPVLHSEEDIKRKEVLRLKVKEYMERAESLKEIIQPSRALDFPGNMATDLEKLSVKDSKIKRALAIVVEAETLVEAEKYEEAVEKYQNALELMVSLVKAEPPGPRKELLYNEVDKWMRKAENIKSCILVSKLKQEELVRTKGGNQSEMTDSIKDQNSLQQYLANNGLTVPVPIPNVYGSLWSIEKLPVGSEPNKVEFQMDDFAVRLFTFLPGTPLINVPYTEDVLFQTGRFLARYHSCIQGFHSKAIESRITVWSLYKFPYIKEFMVAIEEEEKRKLVTDVIEVFKNRVLPRVDNFPKGIIHGDFNENNVLILADVDKNEYKVCGLLDFGDIHKAPLMFDVAVMMTYCMIECTTMDHLDAAGHALAGYLSEKTLTEEELSLLQVCIAARICQSLVMGAYTYSLNPTNTYVLQTSRTGWTVLRKLWKTDWDSLYSRWNEIIHSKKNN
ncbi:serine/threonine-protein kinase ULK3-like isoform X2 [Tachypleus tridentatus]|uniref:serine/threonine-protein kinase ULK3-like isoform X2 n=1 Tax=Tachypleus tridentatus TaxID=6853 RepID=UPI003FCF6A1E